MFSHPSVLHSGEAGEAHVLEDIQVPVNKYRSLVEFIIYYHPCLKLQQVMGPVHISSATRWQIHQLEKSAKGQIQWQEFSTLEVWMLAQT